MLCPNVIFWSWLVILMIVFINCCLKAYMGVCTYIYWIVEFMAFWWLGLCFDLSVGTRICDCWWGTETALLVFWSCHWCPWYFARCKLLLPFALFKIFWFLSFLKTSFPYCRRVLQWLMMVIKMANGDIGSPVSPQSLLMLELIISKVSLSVGKITDWFFFFTIVLHDMENVPLHTL